MKANPMNPDAPPCTGGRPDHESFPHSPLRGLELTSHWLSRKQSLVEPKAVTG